MWNEFLEPIPKVVLVTNERVLKINWRNPVADKSKLHIIFQWHVISFLFTFSFCFPLPTWQEARSALMSFLMDGTRGIAWDTWKMTAIRPFISSETKPCQWVRKWFCSFIVQFGLEGRKWTDGRFFPLTHTLPTSLAPTEWCSVLWEKYDEGPLPSQVQIPDTSVGNGAFLFGLWIKYDPPQLLSRTPATVPLSDPFCVSEPLFFLPSFSAVQ